MEVGLGIHGEPGIYKRKIMNADEITELLLEKILEDIEVKEDEEVAVLVNGLGGTPIMELYIVNRDLHEILEEKNIKIYKTLVGNFMTSLEMAGFSLTVLKLDDELKELLDFKANTPALKMI